MYETETGGANHFGSQRSVLNFLNVRNGKLFLMPTEMDVVYVLEKPNGKQYTVNAKVAARASIPCLKLAKSEHLRLTSPTEKARMILKYFDYLGTSFRIEKTIRQYDPSFC